MKTITALKPKLVSAKEIADLKTKFWKLKTTVSTYQTRGKANVCTLYTFWQWNEKVWQMHDYGYAINFKDFVHKIFYTTEKAWLDK